MSSSPTNPRSAIAPSPAARPLGLDLLQLIGQLLGEWVHFTRTSRDPFQLPHTHALSTYRPGDGS
ncbi:hypothetical protein OHA79_16795 [Streptomyces sp. NBC_00841]|uniref:hypothetical protein n=1 Tax=unclassified Streptomyces TaxID=2593676 RepID=UPI0022580F34|nr:MULTISPECIES: hypothetical protein [unclassified Streptomyces]MCX4535345.1 hypothetical protein [Streptomyces sp. NBC_01669]WSA04712.1 hypothetical protein OHA79_16795 [Streptomyces sp. NBC_00841]